MNKTLLSLAVALASVAGGAAQAANVQLAENQAVLDAWAQAGGQPAAVVTDGDGGTRLEWRNSISVDAYHTEAEGSALLTPKVTGDYRNVTIDSGLAQARADGSRVDGTLGFSVVNDRSVASDDVHIGTLQLARTGRQSRVAFGDVAASYSALGLNLGLRGLAVDRKVGDTTISGAVGVVAESWETLAGRVDATSLQRNVGGVKVDMPAGIDGLRASLSFAAHQDDESSISDGLSTPEALEGNVATAGLAWTHERITATLEAGSSRWQQAGGTEGDDTALTVDVAWNGEGSSLRSGWHEIGESYGALSGATLGGIREAYVAGSRQVNDWLSLNADARHTENEPAVQVNPPPAVQAAAESDRVMVGAGINFTRWPGASLQLSLTSSDGENSDGTDNTAEAGALTFGYTQDAWFGNLGWQRSTVQNDAAGGLATSGDVDTWSAGLGRRWDALAGWALDASLNGSNQVQSFDSGGEADSTAWTLSLAGEHERLGRIDLSAMTGQVTNPLTNETLDQESLQADYAHGLGKYGELGLYWHDVTDLSGDSGLESSDSTWGLKYSGQF